MSRDLLLRPAVSTRPQRTMRNTQRVKTSTMVGQAIQTALDLPLLDRDAALQRIGVSVELRRGSQATAEMLSTLEAIALTHLLRAHAAELQRAAEVLAEATQASVAAVARDAYELALQQPDVEGAIEIALQPLFDLCG